MFVLPFDFRSVSHNNLLALLKVTPDLRGCPPVSSRVLWKKNSYACHFKGKHGKLYIVGKLNKCRFGKKKMNCQFFYFHKRKLQKWPPKWPCVIQLNKRINRVQNSADFCEIWPERSLDVVKQKCVGDFENYNISPMAIFNATPIAHSLLLELDKLNKK